MGNEDYGSAVRAAFETAGTAGGDDGGSAEGAAPPVAVESSPVEAAPDTGSETASSPDGGGSQKTAAERARDAAGRFSAKSKTQEVAKPVVGKPAAESPSAEAPPTAAEGAQLPEAAAVATKAPQGLTPSEREAFAQASPEIQKALARLDQTSRQALQESAPARQLANAFQETVSPYVGMMRAAGAQNPLQAVGGILQQWAVLQGGNAENKAHLVASIVRQSGIPIELLAQAIDGGPQGQGQQQPQHFDPVAFRQQVKQELMQDFQGQRQQMAQSQAQQEAQAFMTDPANEWAEDVRDSMAALLSGGRKMTIQEAYDRAIWSHPEIRDILQKRKAADAAKAATASTQQARIAASSVKSTPSTAASSVRAPRTVKEAVQAAFDQADGL